MIAKSTELLRGGANYCVFGDDGHLYRHPDQKLAKKLFFKQMRQAFGRPGLKDPETCDHGRKMFNGHVWRCSDCAVKI